MDEEVKPNKPKNKLNKKLIFILVAIALAGIIFSFIYSIFINYLTAIPVVKVPNVIGMEEQAAQDVLKNSKLEGYFIGRKFSESISENLVTATNPEPGNMVKANRKIGYMLSAGIEGGMTPDFTGLSMEQAMHEISGKQYKLEEGGKSFSSEVREGYVISQDPMPGHYCTPDVPIKVFVSKGFPIDIKFKTIEPGSNKLTVQIDLQVLANKNNRKTNIRIVSLLGDVQKILYNESILPEKELFFEIEETIGAKIEIFINNELVKSQEVIEQIE